MAENETQMNPGRRASRSWIGIILLIAGTLLLAHKIGAPIPYWVFSWPVLLILIGFLAGIKSGFQNAGAFVMMIVGSVFLVDQIVPELNFDNYILPALLIGVGLLYLLRPKHSWGNMSKNKWRENSCGESKYNNADAERSSYSLYEDTATGINTPKMATGRLNNDPEYVDINAVFGGVKKVILSKNFKGGEINSFMGGTELNLLQADIQHPIVLVVNNVFGGTKLVVPSNWDLKNELTAIFGGIEDKRAINSGITDPGKIVLLKGACIFGGIEVSNY